MSSVWLRRYARGQTDKQTDRQRCSSQYCITSTKCQLSLKYVQRRSDFYAILCVARLLLLVFAAKFAANDASDKLGSLLDVTERQSTGSACTDSDRRRRFGLVADTGSCSAVT